MCVTVCPTAVCPSPKSQVYALEVQLAVKVTVSGALPETTFAVCPQAACAAGANTKVRTAIPSVRTNRNVIVAPAGASGRLAANRHGRAEGHDREQPEDCVVRQPDAAVRDGLADREWLVRPVDPDRTAVRPSPEHVRERGDPDRPWPVRPELIGDEEALRDEEGAQRRRGRR